MATAHLICGPIGAGKSTLALRLAASCHAVHFSLDEWLATLFGPDLPQPVRHEWVQARIRRCEEQIWRLAARLLALGVDVVLDLGFLQRSQRDRVRAQVRQAGGTARLYVVTADVEVRRERVRNRNLQRAGTFTLIADDAVFDWAERHYQPPAPDEAAEVA